MIARYQKNVKYFSCKTVPVFYTKKAAAFAAVSVMISGAAGGRRRACK